MTEPTTTDWRALCARMADELDHYRQLLMDDRRATHALAAEARAALAQPEPQGPTDDEPTDQEIEEWADAAAEVPLEEMDPEVHGWRRCFKSDEFSETIRAALARWGRPAIEPVLLTPDAAFAIGQTGGPPSEAERLAFEAWMRGHSWLVAGKWNGTTYADPQERYSSVDVPAMQTRMLWAAWRDRAALGYSAIEPVPVSERLPGPTDEELWDLYQDLGRDFSPTEFARTVLARWGRPAIEPVPVSEGMPGPEDVNDDGEVWVEEPAYDYPLGDTGDYDSEPGRWVLRPLSSLDKRFKRRWLPYWALPVPAPANTINQNNY